MSENHGGERAEAVAVIVVNWNSGRLLERCLEALAEQSLRPRRVFVVDNGSSDGSLECAGRWPETLTVLRNQSNLGFAAANNLAAKQAEGCQWLALLNPDAFPERDWLERLVEAARGNSGYTFFASRLLWEQDERVLDGAGDVYAVSGLAWRRGHRQPDGPAFRSSGEVFSPCAAAALYRRDLFLEAGGFDERFFCYFEDVDLAFRLRLMGERCLYVPEAVVRHVGSGLTGRRSEVSTYYGHRNLVWTFVKNMPGPLLLAYLPHHVLLNLITVVWLSLRGQLRPALRAKWDALRGLPAAIRSRGAIQSHRRVGALELRGSMVRGWAALTGQAAYEESEGGTG